VERLEEDLLAAQNLPTPQVASVADHGFPTAAIDGAANGEWPPEGCAEGSSPSPTQPCRTMAHWQSPVCLFSAPMFSRARKQGVSFCCSAVGGCGVQESRWLRQIRRAESAL
jgi:hypothetical protein